MNRRMRNRTSGGVGGRRGKPRLLPDFIQRAVACRTSRQSWAPSSFSDFALIQSRDRPVLWPGSAVPQGAHLDVLEFRDPIIQGYVIMVIRVILIAGAFSALFGLRAEAGTLYVSDSSANTIYEYNDQNQRTV